MLDLYLKWFYTIPSQEFEKISIFLSLSPRNLAHSLNGNKWQKEFITLCLVDRNSS